MQAWQNLKTDTNMSLHPSKQPALKFCLVPSQPPCKHPLPTASWSLNRDTVRYDKTCHTSQWTSASQQHPVTSQSHRSAFWLNKGGTSKATKVNITGQYNNGSSLYWDKDKSLCPVRSGSYWYTKPHSESSCYVMMYGPIWVSWNNMVLLLLLKSVCSHSNTKNRRVTFDS